MLNRKVQLVLSTAIVILLVLGAVSYHSIVVSNESNGWVRHTHEVVKDLQNLASDTASIESSNRGFALTGEESYLQSYTAGVVSAERDEAAVRDLTVDNPRQQRRLPALKELIAQKIQLGNVVIALRRTKGLKAAADAIGSGQEEGVTNEFGVLVREMQDEELRLLALRNADAEQRSRRIKVVLVLGTILALLMASVAGWSVQRDNCGRKLAQALRDSTDSEAKYRGLLEAAPDAMVVVNQGGEIVLVNVQAEKQFGYRRDELVGQQVKNIIPEGFAERVIADGTRSAAEALAQQIGMGIELIGHRKNGSEFPIEIMLSPLESPEGILVTAAIRDISVRKAAETNLAQMEGRYRGLLEAAPDAMVVVNVAGEIVLLNVRAEKEFGYRRDELVGQQVKNIIPEGFAERIIADGTRSAAEALAQQIGMGIELIGHRKNGSEFPIEIMLSPLESPEGILVTAAIRDISVRKAAETNLAQMEGRYRGLLEAAPDAMVVVNVAGEIVLLNVRAEKEFGYRRDELVGQQVKNIIPEGFAERIIADGTRSAAEALAQQIGMGIELIGHRKNGSEFPIEIMLSPLESPEGILVTAAIRDISARKESERLVRTVRELKRSNDELQQFAYVSSHDLQEPLRMVSSYTQLLAKRYKGRLDSDADDFISYAVAGCHRMQDLIHDLLAYSRAGSNTKVLREVSSQDSLQKALINLQVTIEQSGAVVTHDSLPAVTTDETQLSLVFQNLVGNAIKYHGLEAPRVHVSATRNGDNEWIFSVRDNGLGIDPQYFERIFIIFQRLHGRDEFEGTGIGLAICKKMLERLGGRIWVESQLEKGSTFYFALPEEK